MKNVLIIDDEKHLCDSLGTIINQSNLASRVFCTTKPLEALECIRATRIDIAIIDIIMPDIQGFEVLKELKKHHPKSRAFILSGFGDHATRREALRLGAERFLPKPFEPDEILNLMRDD